MGLHKYFRLALSLLIVGIAILHASYFLRIAPVESLDRFFYDARVVATLPGGKDPRVIVIDIDEESLGEVGRWPWGRDKIGQLVENLFEEYEISVLGFDVLFAEPDRSSGLKVLETMADGPFANIPGFKTSLNTVRNQLEYDRRFADALRDRKVVLGFAASDVEGTVNVLPTPVMSANDPRLGMANLVERPGVTGNLPILQEAAATAGFFDNALVGDDGIFRRMPVIYQHGDGIYESLALAMYRLHLGSPPIQLKFAGDSGNPEDLEFVEFDFNRVPVDSNAAVLVPYRGAYGSFNYISAADVLAKRADKSKMEGALAIVGSTAAGLMDLRATPVDHIYPGVEVHANILSGFLDPDGKGFKQDPGYNVGFEVLMLFILGLALSILLPRLNALLVLVVTLTSLAIAVAFNLFAWQSWNLSLPLASQVTMIAALLLFQLFYSFFIEARNRRELGRMFGQYVPPEIVDEMDTNPNVDFGMEGDSRNMSVLFSDVRGFTTISEQIPPNQLTQMMNGFLTPMTGVIHHQRGTIDKYMGDAIMAFWGAPLADDKHASHAVSAGLEMISKLPEINAELEKNDWPAINIGVGVNTGAMSVGNMGSEFRMAYTVMGDAVNLGSRLEGLTKQYGVRFIVSEYTIREAPEYIYRELDLVKPKGKNEPVAIFEPLGLEADVDEATMSKLKRYRNCLDLYRNQQWDQAEMNFASLSAESPNELLYKVYIERIAALRNNPPGPGWDAVFTATSK